MIYLLGAALIFVITQAGRAVEEVEGVILQNSENWTKFDALFVKYGRTYGVDWKWLKAIAMNESSLGSVASVKRGLETPKDIAGSKSFDGKSWGLMQVTVTTGKDLDPTCSPEKLNDPEYSVMLAAKYISMLQKKFSMVDIRWQEFVIKSYNQGPGNTMKEQRGQTEGYADEYWARFQRNLEKVG